MVTLIEVQKFVPMQVKIGVDDGILERKLQQDKKAEQKAFFLHFDGGIRVDQDTEMCGHVCQWRFVGKGNKKAGLPSWKSSLFVVELESIKQG
jgi:hypothetical protein